jgi:hypothetical protein
MPGKGSIDQAPDLGTPRETTRVMAVRRELLYYGGLLRAAPLPALMRAQVRKVARAASRLGRRTGAPLPYARVRAAGRALARAPRLFRADDAIYRRVYEEALPGAAKATLEHAQAWLRGEARAFGRAIAVNAFDDDPLSGRAHAELPAGMSDARGPWELARFGWAVELGVAARLEPSLAAPLREAFVGSCDAFARACPPDSGLHWSSPLELALRAVHIIAALELMGGALAFDPTFGDRLAALLLLHGDAITAELEDTGVVCGTHLVGNLLGLHWLGVALDVAPWRTLAHRRLPAALARQVRADGSDFEGSTAYHRFALELVVAAHVFAEAAGDPLPASVRACMGRMFRYVAGHVTPGGCEPGIGDGDDSRVLPFAQRGPREVDYLLAVGAALLGDATLKSVRGRMSAEALWLAGPAGYDRYRALEPARTGRSQAFGEAGLYVLRDGDDYAAIRCGAAGQDGVGGHSHNDQLSIVVHVGGAPVVIDPGTARYTGDRLLRDRFRGTAAHATVVVDGREQSALMNRPFALFDRARARALLWQTDDSREQRAVGDGNAPRLMNRFVGEHRGFAPVGVVHTRELLHDRAHRTFVVTDFVCGVDLHDVAVCYPLAGPARRSRSAVWHKQLLELRASCAWARDGFREELLVEVGPAWRPTALLVPLAGAPLDLILRDVLTSPCYGGVELGVAATFRVRSCLPWVMSLAIIAPVASS